MIRETRDLSAEIVQPGDAVTSPRFTLCLKDGKRTRSLIGKQLEAQFRLPESYLVLATEDCPYEEALHVYLISLQGELLDSAELSATYHTGSFELIDLTENGLLFRFFADEVCELEVAEDTFWRLPKMFSPVTYRPLAGQGRLRLNRIPDQS